jgi:hypothetical protein
MVFKDKTLLEEAYISASQKSINLPSNLINPAPEIVAVTNTPQEEIPMQEPHQDSACGCGGSEEQEESYMDMANLFSLFSNAKKIHHFLESGMSLEPWMQQKIAVCADNLEAVMRSTRYDAAKSGMTCD